MVEPFVGVVIPCYNAASTIGRTLESLLLTAYSNYEVILVNDGSTDETLDILNNYASKDARFLVIDQKNSGVSSARNNGVAAASADYIAFLDADDVFFYNSLSERMKLFASNADPEMIGVFCPSIMLGENLELLSQNPLFNYSLPDNRFYLSSLDNSVFLPSSVIIKKEVFIGTGGFDESLSFAEDFEFWYRVMHNGGYFRKVAECYVGWTQHTAGVSHMNILKSHKQCRVAVERISRLTEDMSIPEIKKELGEKILSKYLTQKSLAGAITATIMGQHAAAEEISLDIEKICIDHMNSFDLIETVRFCTMRVLCRPEEDWPGKLWPPIKIDILRFLLKLSERFSYSCKVLTTVINYLDQLAASRSNCEVIKTSPSTPGSDDNDSIEILSVSLIDEHRDIADMIHRKSAELNVGLGWHYLLDLIWIIGNIKTLPPGSFVLDAGAGNGLLQFLLADMGYRVISADFSERIIPQKCLEQYTILQAKSGKLYDNEYIRHLKNEFQAQNYDIESALQTETSLRDQLEQCQPGTIIYYRVDLCAMDQIDNASIDCVVSISALEHNNPENITKAVIELERVLRPDGQMLITVSATDREDWYHNQSKGWCLTEATLTSLFSLRHPLSNFNLYNKHLNGLKSCSHLQQHLDPVYYRSGNNGMPWGKWDPQYQPVGIHKLKMEGPARSTARSCSTSQTAPQPQHTAFSSVTPMTVLIDTTDGCNLHCTFCSRNNSKIRMMNADEFDLILGKISPYVTSLQLSCAWEFSIAPDAHNIVRTLGRYGIKTTSIYTNGQILPEKLAESIIDAGITDLVFSIGEVNQETYERIRKGGRLEKIIRNIEMVHQMKIRTGTLKPRLCANLTVISSNIGELIDFVSMAHNLGITEIRGRHLILNEGVELDTEVIRDTEYANGIIEAARKQAEEYGMSFQIPLYPTEGGEKNCRAPWSQLYISSNGDVAVCPRIHKYSTIGNLLDQEMQTILASSELSGLQHQMRSNSFSNPVCGICTQNKETEIYINQGF